MVLSIDRNVITECDFIEGGGEVYFFADFDNDGVLEFVNTDSERDFVYDANGMPISDRVWVLDRKQKKYIKTSDSNR